MDAELMNQLPAFLECIMLNEEPMGIYYTDTAPENCVSPKSQRPLSREAEEKCEIDWLSVHENFSCVLGIVWRARNKGAAACFDRERFGCPGGAFYLGFLKPYLTVHPHFISTGIPGIIEGEQYFDSPESAQNFFEIMDPPPASHRHCVIQPLSQFGPDAEPDTIVFFGRPEVLSGLCTLMAYITNDIDAVRTPFGPGCSGLVTWPAKYRLQGKEYAVLGSFDPSCRRYLKTDELTFAVSPPLFRKMLTRWSESFLTTETWKTVQKKIDKSKKTWGEGSR